MKLPGKGHNHQAQLSRCTDKTAQLERSAGTTPEVCMGEGFIIVFLDRNLVFNSDAAQNYKYVFGPRGVFYLASETTD